MISGLVVCFPAAVPLLRTALDSCNFDQCPSPADWQQCCRSMFQAIGSAPSLQDLEPVDSSDFEAVVKRRRLLGPVWPAPALRDLQEPQFARRRLLAFANP
jgi:hypothetical protein